MIKQLCGFVVLMGLLLSEVASAYEVKSGLVKKVTINTPAISNRSVMVELEGVASMCAISSNSESGYFNKADTPDTFSSLVSTLLMAQASGRPVVVFTIPGAEGCRIDQVQLAG